MRRTARLRPDLLPQAALTESERLVASSERESLDEQEDSR